jgi:hypothetical protein
MEPAGIHLKQHGEKGTVLAGACELLLGWVQSGHVAELAAIHLQQHGDKGTVLAGA